MSWEIRCGDALERLREMPDESVQCCVTSPPYWGLRDYGVDGQLGLEETPEQFAGTPSKVCGECGAPWQRVTESEFVPQEDVAQSDALQRSAEGLDQSSGWADTPRGTTKRTTLGVEPTCECNAEPVPSVVFDPFAGAATTGLVATRHNRDFIGIELNPEYVELGRDRIRNDAPLLNEPAEQITAEPEPDQLALAASIEREGR